MINKYITNPRLTKKLSTDKLLEYMRILNQAYRQGNPMIHDSIWDYYWEEELNRRDPDRLIDRVQFF